MSANPTQAVWYFACARLLHEQRVAWDSYQPVPDMAPGMFAPGKAGGDLTGAYMQHQGFKFFFYGFSLFSA